MIATRSGGHFATLYTHIDDFVESTRSLTPAGVLKSRCLSGSGAGPSPDRMMIGSEGSRGIITEAWMRLQDRPKFRASTAVLFDKLEDAAETIRVISQAGLYPPNVWLLNATEAELSGFGDGKSTIVVLAFENADHPVGAWMNRAMEICADHGGRAENEDDLEGGNTSGTAGAWRDADGSRRGHWWQGCGKLPVHPRLSGRSCTLLHICWRRPPRRPQRAVAGDQKRASDALIKAGGTITHHHAVGRDHMPWYETQRPDLFGTALSAVKSKFDPAGILNPGVIV